jgi:hypothetical protein
MLKGVVMRKRTVFFVMSTLILISATLIFAQAAGTPVTFASGPFTGTAANKVTYASVTLSYTPATFPATMQISDGANVVTLSKASSTSAWVLTQSSNLP